MKRCVYEVCFEFAPTCVPDAVIVIPTVIVFFSSSVIEPFFLLCTLYHSRTISLKISCPKPYVERKKGEQQRSHHQLFSRRRAFGGSSNLDGKDI